MHNPLQPSQSVTARVGIKDVSWGVSLIFHLEGSVADLVFGAPLDSVLVISILLLQLYAMGLSLTLMKLER